MTNEQIFNLLVKEDKTHRDIRALNELTFVECLVAVAEEIRRLDRIKMDNAEERRRLHDERF
jgi:hypothetical protein